jgi:hypothetical protein
MKQVQIFLIKVNFIYKPKKIKRDVCGMKDHKSVNAWLAEI